MADDDSTFTPEQLAELAGVLGNGRTPEEIEEIIRRLGEALRFCRRSSRGPARALESQVREALEGMRDAALRLDQLLDNVSGRTGDALLAELLRCTAEDDADSEALVRQLLRDLPLAAGDLANIHVAAVQVKVRSHLMRFLAELGQSIRGLSAIAGAAVGSFEPKRGAPENLSYSTAVAAIVAALKNPVDGFDARIQVSAGDGAVFLKIVRVVFEALGHSRHAGGLAVRKYMEGKK